MLVETIAEAWMKNEETENELREAKVLIADSKENIGSQLPFLLDVPTPVVTQPSVKPFGHVNYTISTLPEKLNTVQYLPVPVQVARVPKAEPVDLPNRSLTNDSPSSSRGSRPVGRNVDIDDMSGALSLLELRLP
jgi:hypothetical protein